MTFSARRFWSPHIDRRAYGEITSARAYAGSRRQILLYTRLIVDRTLVELERHYRWTLDRVDFFFLSKRKANAAVFRHGNRHAVGFCVGLPFSLKRHIDRAMADPEFLPQYLTAQERPEWAMRFLGMIVEHAFLHELAHALRAHFGYIAEHDARSFDEQSRSLNPYLELDADIQALDMQIALAEAADDFPDSTALKLDYYFQCVFTTHLLHQVLDADGLRIAEYRKLGHPPPAHRALLLGSALKQTAPERFNLSPKAVENAHHQAFWEASIAARAAKLTPDRWWGGKSGRRRGVQAFRRTLDRYLKVEKPKIDAFVDAQPDDLV